jgi:broad specificity phosphatase PhoE
MMDNIIYFVHSTTTDNLIDVSSGWSDVKLSDLGIQRAIELKHKTWEQAFAQDWRKTKSWQPGWEYTLK